MSRGSNPGFPPNSSRMPEAMGPSGPITGLTSVSASMLGVVPSNVAVSGLGSANASILGAMGPTHAMTGLGAVSASMLGVVPSNVTVSGLGSASASILGAMGPTHAMTGLGSVSATMLGVMGLTSSPLRAPDLFALQPNWSRLAMGATYFGEVADLVRDHRPLLRPDIEVELEARRASASGALRLSGFRHLDCHLAGAFEATLWGSTDRWSHFAASARHIIQAVLGALAPQTDSEVIDWVSNNYPHETTKNGLPNFRGRVHYTLRHHGGSGYSLDNVDALTQFLMRVNTALHRPGFVGDDLHVEFGELADLLAWFLPLASGSRA